MTTGDMDILAQLRKALIQHLGQDRYELWFGAKTRLVFDETRLTVEVATPFFRDWLRTNFRDVLQRSFQEITGQTPPIDFRVCVELASESSENDTEQVTDDPPARPEPERPAPRRNGRSREKAADAAAALRRRPFADFESFVVGHSNRVAHASARMAADEPGSVTPLLLWGGTGVGKTHLLESIFTAVTEQSSGGSGLMLAAEQFTTLFLEALHHSGLPSFRRKYRGVKLLILDDVQFFQGKKSTTAELLHTIDTLLRSGRQVVLAADRPPSEFDGLGPELTSRLNGGMVCRLSPPDLETRCDIVRRYVERRGIVMPPGVQQMVASRLTDNARELFGAVNRLQATSQAMDKPITAALAEEALSDLIQHSGPVVQLSDIERAVCQTFGLRPDSLRSSRKIKSVSHPRMLAMWLARKHTRSALSEIGDFFGRRSHTTVISAQKRVGSWLSQGDQVDVASRKWHVEEAIRRVEEKLRAG